VPYAAAMLQQAISEELQQMEDEDVFEYVSKGDIPYDANIIGSMFTLTIKRNPNTGQIDKYKARLVALGNHQSPESYSKIKSMTARSASVKLLIALQAKTGAQSMVLDVKGAYLKSEINMEKNEKLHLRLPNGRLVKLKKYLYGLKQAGAEWQDNITATLVSNGYQPSVDPLIFSKWSDDNFIIMSVH